MGAGRFDMISIGRKQRFGVFLERCRNTVLRLSTTWLRLAFLHSPASASSALPGFFMRGRMSAIQSNSGIAARSIASLLLFAVGLASAIAIVDAGTDSLLLGMSVWFGSGALMGVGLLLPFRHPVWGALLGVLIMGAVIGVLQFLFRNGT
jgi:hypothetical protein